MTWSVFTSFVGEVVRRCCWVLFRRTSQWTMSGEKIVKPRPGVALRSVLWPYLNRFLTNKEDKEHWAVWNKELQVLWEVFSCLSHVSCCVLSLHEAVNHFRYNGIYKMSERRKESSWALRGLVRSSNQLEELTLELRWTVNSLILMFLS